MKRRVYQESVSGNAISVQFFKKSVQVLCLQHSQRMSLLTIAWNSASVSWAGLCINIEHHLSQKDHCDTVSLLLRLPHFDDFVTLKRRQEPKQCSFQYWLWNTRYVTLRQLQNLLVEPAALSLLWRNDVNEVRVSRRLHAAHALEHVQLAPTRYVWCHAAIMLFPGYKLIRTMPMNVLITHSIFPGWCPQNYVMLLCVYKAINPE